MSYEVREISGVEDKAEEVEEVEESESESEGEGEEEEEDGDRHVFFSFSFCIFLTSWHTLTVTTLRTPIGSRQGVSRGI